MRLRLLLVSMLVIILSIPCLAGNTLTAKGKVVDLQGKPVEGIPVYAMMWWHDGNGKMISIVKSQTVSDKDGSFSFDSLPKLQPLKSSQYIFTAYMPGKWLGWTEGKADLTTMSRLEPVPEDGYVIIVSSPWTYKGQIVDENGNGIPNVKVRIRHLYRIIGDGGESIMPEYVDSVVKFNSTTTDAQGNYTLTGVPEGAEVIPEVTHPGYAFKDWDRPKDGKIGGIRAGSLSGRVIDETGNPVPGMIVLAIATSYNGTNKAITNKDGYYKVTGLPPGTYYVGCFKSGILAKPVTGINIFAGKHSTARAIIVRHGVSMTGRVLDADTGTPVAKAELHVGGSTAPPMHFNWNVAATTNSNGEYSVRVLPGDVYLHYSSAPPAYPGTPGDNLQIGTVPASGASGIDIKLKKADVARGRVVDENGNLLADVAVVVYTGLVSNSGARSTTNRNGYFEVTIPEDRGFGWGSNLPDGTVVLHAKDSSVKQGCFVSIDREKLIKENVTLTAKPTLSLKVIVKDKNGTPLKGANVLHGNRIEMLTFRNITNADGMTIVNNIYQGGDYYYLSAKLDGYYFKGNNDLPAPGGPDWKDTVELTMEEAGRTQKGKVVDQDGKPVAGIEVYPSFDYENRTKTDANGEFILNNMPDSEVYLYANTENQTGETKVDKNTGDVTITLRRKIR